MDFLNRSMPLLGEDGAKALKDSKVLIAGLGGVGGITFLSLVRSGVGSFVVADGGIFDPPDMNRQALAFSSTMESNKAGVYVHYAHEINPKLNIVSIPGRLTVENVDYLMDECDVFIRLIDWQNGQDVKDVSVALAEKYGIPMFQAYTVGVSGMMYNYKPGGMKPEEFWKLVTDKREKVAKYLYTDELDRRYTASFGRGENPSMAIGVNAASLLLTSSVLEYLLRGTALTDNDPIFMPRFVVLDPFQMELNILDIKTL